MAQDFVGLMVLLLVGVWGCVGAYLIYRNYKGKQ